MIEGLPYIVGAWLVYAIYGLLSSLVKGEKFDPMKFGRSFIWAILVSLFAVVGNFTPTQVTTQYGYLINTVLNAVMTSGPGIAAIWFVDRTYQIFMGFANKVKATINKEE